MPEKEHCLKWVGSKCVKWDVVDGKLTADINQKNCPVETMKEIKETIGKSTGFRFRFKE